MSEDLSPNNQKIAEQLIKDKKSKRIKNSRQLTKIYAKAHESQQSRRIHKLEDIDTMISDAVEAGLFDDEMKVSQEQIDITRVKFLVTKPSKHPVYHTYIPLHVNSYHGVISKFRYNLYL